MGHATPYNQGVTVPGGLERAPTTRVRIRGCSRAEPPVAGVPNLSQRLARHPDVAKRVASALKLARTLQHGPAHKTFRGVLAMRVLETESGWHEEERALAAFTAGDVKRPVVLDISPVVDHPG
jgi:hypothetical protein